MHHDSNRGACEWGTRGKLIFTAQSTMPVIPGWHAGKNPNVKIWVTVQKYARHYNRSTASSLNKCTIITQSIKSKNEKTRKIRNWYDRYTLHKQFDLLTSFIGCNWLILYSVAPQQENIAPISWHNEQGDQLKFIPLLHVGNLQNAGRGFGEQKRTKLDGAGRHTSSIAFRHLPLNSATIGYAREGPIFISAQLSTDVVGAFRKVWYLIRLWKQHSREGRT